MALPTAAWSGYGYLYTLGDTPNVACDCVIEWWGWFVKLCQKRGYGTPVLWQASGGYGSSVGTHERGGAMDWGGLDLRKMTIAREGGAPATWTRKMYKSSGATNFHTHSVLSGCVHNEPARYQVTAQWLGFNGLGFNGWAGLDPHSRPKVYRNWREGIAWMKAQLGITTTASGDVMTPEQEKKLDYVSSQVKATAQLVLDKYASTAEQIQAVAKLVTADDAEKDALFAQVKASLAAQPDAVTAKVWARPVRREGGTVTAIQDQADGTTLAGLNRDALAEVAKALTEIRAELAAIKAAQ